MGKKTKNTNPNKSDNYIPGSQNNTAGNISERVKKIVLELEQKANAKADDDEKATKIKEVYEKAEKDANEKLKEIQDCYEQIKQEQAEINKQKKEVEESLAEAKEQEATILAETKKEAAEIVAKAEQEAKEALHAAKEQYNALIEDGKKLKEKAIAEKEELARVREQQILASAQNEAEKITQDAQMESERILQRAEAEKQRFSEAAVKAADDIRACAEQYRLTKQEQFDAKEAELQALEQDYKNKLAEVEAEKEAKFAEMTKEINMKQVELAIREDELAMQKDVLKQDKEKLQFNQKNLDKIVEERIAEILEVKDHEIALKNKLLNKFVKDLQKRQERLDELQNKITAERVASIESQAQEIAALEKQLAEALKYKSNYDDLVEKYEAIKEEKENLEHVNLLRGDVEQELNVEKMRNCSLKEMVLTLSEELNEAKKISRDTMLEPITTEPDNLQDLADAIYELNEEDEVEWLEGIRKQAKEGGIIFTKRQLKAYHTALKVEDWSPMVVLAGVSGTGKSELPKQYAKHGGLHFLSIPVKPDWDSPASLFGYYNSIENKFEATELLRSLYQMQNNNTYRQQMLLILLDEMNLAHPEQYFADLLSKFESARGEQKNAQYEITLGSGERPELLEIGKNILWTGTMNEDETTKGLSDKVVDRSTFISFPRPKELYDRNNDAVMPEPEQIMTMQQWNTWKKMAINENSPLYVDVVCKKMETYKHCVQNINKEMSKMSRNLGHRVWQSIQNYILNYPDVIKASQERNEEALNNALDDSFADALAFKVMPKLRGLERDGENKQYLDEIRDNIKCNAPELVKDYENAREHTSGLFQWCSAEFMTDKTNSEGE